MFRAVACVVDCFSEIYSLIQLLALYGRTTFGSSCGATSGNPSLVPLQRFNASTLQQFND
jgi:hypothetical protein